MNNRPVNRGTNRPSTRPTDQSILLRVSSSDANNGSETSRRFLEDFNMEHSASFGAMNLIAASKDSRSKEQVPRGHRHQVYPTLPSCVYLG
jgi:hypothetical protein